MQTIELREDTSGRTHAAESTHPAELTFEATEQLERALLAHHTAEGFALLDELQEAFLRVDPRRQNAVRQLLALAQWVDLGYGDVDLLRRVRARFDRMEAGRLPMVDFLTLRLVDTLVCMMTEQTEEAAELLEMISRLGKDILPWNLVFLTHFWKGRIHRRRGEYESALHHITAAKRYASMTDAPMLVAVCKIHESWLSFQNGSRDEAFRLLDEAEAELKDSGHALSLGNIASARGRIVRRSGEYHHALRHFEGAIALYTTMRSPHVNLARALVNAAYVKRLIALELRPSAASVAMGSVHARCQQLTRDALEMLGSAREVYTAHGNQHGLGSVLVNAGSLHLEAGNATEAGAEAERALQLGQEIKDGILMARACNLWSAVELATADDTVDHATAAFHRAQALRLAEQAIAIATQTQNRRLLAEACIRRGSVAAEEATPDYETAREYASRAATLLSEGDRDHLYQELVQLKHRILRANGIHQTLRLWSNGEVGNKTFREVEEEFAEIVISKVWQNLGRNVSRVAEQLSISPKKVRRALRNVKEPMR